MIFQGVCETQKNPCPTGGVTMSKSEKYTHPPEAARATYHAYHDWTDTEPLSTTVMTSIAKVMGADPTEIGPLYERFDPDALDRLFSPQQDGRTRSGGHIGFTFDGFHVCIQSDGHISIHPPSNTTGDVERT